MTGDGSVINNDPMEDDSALSTYLTFQLAATDCNVCTVKRVRVQASMW